MRGAHAARRLRLRLHRPSFPTTPLPPGLLGWLGRWPRAPLPCPEHANHSLPICSPLVLLVQGYPAGYPPPQVLNSTSGLRRCVARAGLPACHHVCVCLPARHTLRSSAVADPPHPTLPAPACSLATRRRRCMCGRAAGLGWWSRRGRWRAGRGAHATSLLVLCLPLINVPRPQSGGPTLRPACMPARTGLPTARSLWGLPPTRLRRPTARLRRPTAWLRRAGPRLRRPTARLRRALPRWPPRPSQHTTVQHNCTAACAVLAAAAGAPAVLLSVAS